MAKGLHRTLVHAAVAVIMAMLLVASVAVPAEASWFFERWYNPDPEPPVSDPAPEPPAPEPPAPEPPVSEPDSEPSTPTYVGGWARRWLSPPDTSPPPVDDPGVTDPPAQPAPPADPPPADPPSSGHYFSSDYPSSRVRASNEWEMLDLVNKERTDRGLNPLQVDPRLTDAARAKSWDIIDNNYFAHHSPTYGSPWDMLREAQIPFVRAGENLGKAGNVWVVHARLMNSSGHRSNILSPNFTHVGIGIMTGQPSGVVVTQIFVGR